jgi:hypothetical protein
MKLPFTVRNRDVQANFDKLAAALNSPIYKQALTFAANWSNYGGAHEDATYSRFGRLVVLQGFVTKSGTPAAGNTIATLPEGFRPAEALHFAVTTGAADAFGKVEVQADGDIVWNTGATGETDYTSLSGIAFVAA